MIDYILVTGGLGYIGSHTVVELVNKGYYVYIVDNLSNSNIAILEKIKQLCDDSHIEFTQLNILDYNSLDNVFKSTSLSGVIHFAALKSVSESIKYPLTYYENNVNGTLNLLKLCEKYNINKFIFSSSATVYGSSKSPLIETSETGIGITNPYGQSKYMVENILSDLSKTGIKTINLRYFNPVGAHETGLLGENPNGIPNNLMPFVLRVAIKNNLNHELDDVYKELNVFGNDYDTEDGTCKRDFIHVLDLASAHVSAYKYICNMNENNNVFNIGTGKGTSVLEIIDAFEKYNNVKIPYNFSEKRPGDIDIVYCNSSKAEKILNWKSKYTLQNIVKDTWNFAVCNYKS